MPAPVLARLDAPHYAAGVDDEVERLERAVRQDPGDVETALRLKAALLRAGRREELRTRYRLGFVCDQRWNDMTPEAPGARRCAGCDRQVHLTGSAGDFDRLAAAGHCVAVYPHVLPQVLEHLIDAPDRGLARGEGPCLLEGDLPPLPLAGAPRPIDPGPVMGSVVPMPPLPPPSPGPPLVPAPPADGPLKRLRRLLGGG